MQLRTKQTGLSVDPVEVFECLVNQYQNCFLLETLADDNQPHSSGQSYIGVAPKHHFAAKNGLFTVDGRPIATSDPYEALQSRLKTAQDLPAHYVGGLVGYMAHEAMQYIEPTLGFAYKREFFDFEFGRYDDGLIFRRGSSPQYFYSGQDRSKLYEAQNQRPAGLAVDFQRAAKSETRYHAMVDQARQDIQKGRVFQVVLANRYEYRFAGDLFELYKRLRRINPAPFMFFVKFGDRVTMGASPELLTHTAPDGQTCLEALAGTIRCGATPEQDTALAHQLLHDDKEIAEHNMLVDLARNDVGRVSRIGTVRINKLMYLKKLSHVQHLCSLVSGRLAAGKNAFDALAAAFPAGTLVGTPKIEAAKMIHELEGYERGPYGGTVGYFGRNGDSMHAVNIRSVQAAGPKLYLHTGSGIVYDSQAQHEYQEINAKKLAMDHAMQPFMQQGSV